MTADGWTLGDCPFRVMGIFSLEQQKIFVQLLLRAPHASRNRSDEQLMRWTRVFPEYDERLAAEGTGFLLTWLCEQMYICGKVYTPDELVRSLTGEDLNPEHFVQYSQDKFGRFYDLRAE